MSKAPGDKVNQGTHKELGSCSEGGGVWGVVEEASYVTVVQSGPQALTSSTTLWLS